MYFAKSLKIIFPFQGKEDSPVVAAILDDVKRIKVSPALAGRLYPNLSDIEATTETETDVQTRTPSPDDFDDHQSRCDSITNWILFCLCLAWQGRCFFLFLY